MDTQAPNSRKTGADPAGIVIAGALLVVAGVIWWDASTLQLTSTYGVGPKMMPIIIGSGIAILAIANLVLALRGDLPSRDSTALAPIALILGGFAILIAMIAFGGGFILATAILFAATATAFGRRAIFTDLAIGFVIGLFAYLLFDKLLSLSLPAGPLERLL
jgi:putative tricarboxylic transport membrane protein